MSEAPVKCVAVRGADDQRAAELRSMLERHDGLYPGISVWFRRRVLPEICGGGRIVLCVEFEERIVAEAILKLRGASAKLCSFYVEPGVRRTGVAADLLATALARARARRCSDIHFTIGEDGAGEHARYFEQFGFSFCGSLGQRYRKGVDEWVYRAKVNSADAALLSWRRLRMLRHRAEPTALAGDWREAFISCGLEPKEMQLPLPGCR